MRDERNQVFHKSFIDKKEPLVIYGTGKIASALLPYIKDYNIVGILDKDKTSGTWYDIPYLELKELNKFHVKAIVVAAAQRNIPVIYRRIASFCKSNQIKVYDISRRDLSEIYDLYESNIPYFQKNWSDLHSAVEQHEVISFDIFDTLLIRESLYPETVFKIMEKNISRAGMRFGSFSELRISAAANLTHLGLAPSIYEIYDEIQRVSNLTDAEKFYLLNLEIEVEKNLIKPRKSMLNFFNEIKKKRAIYLVSNMHLTKDIIEEILNNWGYYGYKELLVSCEYGRGKESGLFNILIKKSKVLPVHILHIGDSINMDDAEPRKVGIDTFPIMSMVDMASNSSYAALLEHDDSILNQFVLGRFIQEAFDNPFALCGTKGRPSIKLLNQYVNIFLSPLAFLYTLWLLQETKKEKVEYILYTSRDAYLLKKMADLILNVLPNIGFPSGEYFYASRRATSLAAVFEENDAKELAGRSFSGSVEDMFFIRFGIKKIREKELCRDCSTDNIEDNVREYQAEIMANAREQRKCYKKYINQCSIIRVKRIAVVDQCGLGNVQRGLAKIMSDKKLHGIFLRKTPGVIADSDSSSFYPHNADLDIYGGLELAYLVLEQFLSSPEPSLAAFDEKGNPLFEKESRSNSQIESLNRMHAYALSYCEGMCNYMEYIADEMPDWKLVDKILSLLDEKYTDINVPELENMIVEDSFGAASTVHVN